MNFEKVLPLQLEVGSQVHWQAKQVAFRELENLAFQKFRSGEYLLEDEETQRQAWTIIQFTDFELVERIHWDGSFLDEIVIRELFEREILDNDINLIGFYGNDLAKQQAIELMKQKLE
ncbi:MAG: hypothetical protein F6J87_10605 [Spirulina sp. SIO3F2]|nr:hypothetical protein [Spirulina sp. SIO3F2]